MKKTFILSALTASLFMATSTFAATAVESCGSGEKTAESCAKSVVVTTPETVKEASAGEKIGGVIAGLVDTTTESIKTGVDKATDATTGLFDKAKNAIKNVELSEIKDQLKAMNIPESEIVRIGDTPLSDLKEVVTMSGDHFYINTNASMIIFGKMYDVKNTKLIDPAFAQLEKYKDSMIEFKAKDEKHVITAFVDITCHYCNQLVEHMKDYNDLGITVRLLAFPREGLDGKVAKQMESIFTADKRQQAYLDAEAGKLPADLKDPDVVKKHYLLGLDFGVSGTPYIVLESGQIIPGYLEAKPLLEAIEKDKAQQAPAQAPTTQDIQTAK